MLIIRLGNTEDDPVYWLLEAGGKEHCECGILDNVSELKRLSLYFKGTVNVLVSTRGIIFRKIYIKNKKILGSIKSISFAIEKSIFDDIDDFHISILKYDNGFLYIVAVEHKLMRLWLLWLENARIKVKNLIPDVLTLPFIKGEWCAVKLDKEWIVRNSEMSGFSVGEDLFEKIYSSWHSSTPVQTVGSPDIKTINWRIIKNREPLHLMAESIQNCSNSLLIGRYKFYGKKSITYTYILRTASWGGMLSLVICLNLWYDGYRTAQSIDALNTYSDTFYRRFDIIESNSIDDINSDGYSNNFIELLNTSIDFLDDNSLNIVGLHFNKKDKDVFFDIYGATDSVKENWLKKEYNGGGEINISEYSNVSGMYRLTFKHPE